ncbi:MAG TPA: GNAT family N-acetyltransferase [Chloroflexota bacterium]
MRANEPNGPRAGPFFLGRTAAGNVWSIGAGVGDGLAAELAVLARAEPVTADWREPPRCRDEVVGLLGSAEGEWRGPAYVVPAGAASEGPTVAVNGRNATLLGDRFGDLPAQLEARAPCLAVVEGGRALAVCFSSRIGERACEAGVETLPEQRGRGLAGLAVGAWAVEVRRRSKVPFYSTSWQNRSSRRVAEKLGMRPFGEDWHLG